LRIFKTDKKLGNLGPGLRGDDSREMRRSAANE